MLYLFWALLNVVIFVFFIVTCWRPTKMLREKFGLFTAIIFVLGFLSFVTRPANDNKEPNSDQVKTWKFEADSTTEAVEIFSLNEELEKTLISKYQLYIQYGVDTNKQIIPISASSFTIGVSSGTDWKPSSVYIYRTEDNALAYFVDGVVEWTLLGSKIYIQRKEYKGIIKNFQPSHFR